MAGRTDVVAPPKRPRSRRHGTENVYFFIYPLPTTQHHGIDDNKNNPKIYIYLYRVKNKIQIASINIVFVIFQKKHTHTIYSHIYIT